MSHQVLDFFMVLAVIVLTVWAVFDIGRRLGIIGQGFGEFVDADVKVTTPEQQNGYAPEEVQWDADVISNKHMLLLCMEERSRCGWERDEIVYDEGDQDMLIIWSRPHAVAEDYDDIDPGEWEEETVAQAATEGHCFLAPLQQGVEPTAPPAESAPDQTVTPEIVRIYGEALPTNGDESSSV